MRIILPIFLILILGFIGYQIFQNQKIPQKTTQELPKEEESKVEKIKSKLDDSVRKAFISPEDIDILETLDKAESETKTDVSYKLYVKAFHLMIEKIQVQESDELVNAISRLKKYLKTFAEYNAADFEVSEEIKDKL